MAKVSIKLLSTPRPNSDYWDDEWIIRFNGKNIAACWSEQDAELLAKALRKYKKKKCSHPQ